MRNQVVSIALLALIGLSTNSHAYFPFVTDDTGTQGENGNQIEVNYVFFKERGVDFAEGGSSRLGDIGTSNFFPITYTRGLTDDIDVFVGVVRQTTPNSGWTNSEIGLKWRFAGSSEEGWSFAVKPAILIPVSRNMESSGLGNGKTNGTVSFISSYIAPEYELHVNARYTSNYSYYGTSEQNAQHLWGASFSPVLKLNDQWKIGFDTGLDTHPNKTTSHIAYAQIGTVFAPIKNVQLGLGLLGSRAVGTIREYNWSIMTGVAWQF